MDRPNYRRSRKGESIIISHLKKTAYAHEPCIPQKREACNCWCLTTCPWGKTSAMEVTLSEQQTTAAFNGREESLCWIAHKIPLFPILVLTLKKKLCVFGQLIYFPWLLVICRSQELTQILPKVFFPSFKISDFCEYSSNSSYFQFIQCFIVIINVEWMTVNTSVGL